MQTLLRMLQILRWPEFPHGFVPACGLRLRLLSSQLRGVAFMQGHAWGMWTFRPGQQTQQTLLESWLRRWSPRLCPGPCTNGLTSYSASRMLGWLLRRPTMSSTTSPMTTCKPTPVECRCSAASSLCLIWSQEFPSGTYAPHCSLCLSSSQISGISVLFKSEVGHMHWIHALPSSVSGSPCALRV